MNDRDFVLGISGHVGTQDAAPAKFSERGQRAVPGAVVSGAGSVSAEVCGAVSAAGAVPGAVCGAVSAAVCGAVCAAVSGAVCAAVSGAGSAEVTGAVTDGGAPAAQEAEISWGLTIYGAALAAVVGYFSLAVLLRALKGRWFWLFGPYCLAAGLLTLILV